MLSTACYATARSMISVGGKIMASSSASSASAAAAAAVAAVSAVSAVSATATPATSSSSAAATSVSAVWGTQCYPATALSRWEDLGEI